MKYKIGSSILFILLILSCQTRKMHHVGYGGDFKSNYTSEKDTSKALICEENSNCLGENKLEVKTSVNHKLQQPSKSIRERKSKKTKLFIPKKRIVKSLQTHKPNETHDASGFWGFIIIVGMLLALGWGLTILGLSILQVVLIFLGVLVFITLLLLFAELTG